MQSVDEPMGFVEFPAQADRFPAGENLAARVSVKALFFGGFQLLRDLLDLHVEAMKQFPGLCCIGVFTHCGILPSGSVPCVVNQILSATEWGVRHAGPARRPPQNPARSCGLSHVPDLPDVTNDGTANSA
jgi:hypothetical protein